MPRIPGSSSLISSLRGPIIMITIGVLFLLDNVTGLQFGQTWPILLIVTGVLALAGGTRRGADPVIPPSNYSNQPPIPPPPPGVRR